MLKFHRKALQFGANGISRYLSSFSALFPAESSAVGFNNYEEEYSAFQLKKPKHFNFAKDVLQEKWSKKFDQETVEDRGKSNKALWWIDDFGNESQWSFSEVLQESNRISNVLVDECGIQQQERVILILPRIPEWWFLNIACLKTGAIVSPGTTSLTKDDIKKRIALSGASCIVTTREIAREVDKIPCDEIPSLREKVVIGRNDQLSGHWKPMSSLSSQASNQFECVNTKSDDPMSWFFTSGTTGFPKMTEHSHASYGFAHQITGKYWLDLTSSDVIWNVSDTGWAKSAYSSLFGPWWQGACVFVHHSLERFNAKQTLSILKKYPISVTCLPPTAYRLIVQEDVHYDFKALRHCVSAGEPLNPEVMEVWKQKTGMTIREGFGQTEMTLSCGTFRCMECKPGSMGKPAPGYDIQIVDENGEILKAMEEGEIAINCHPEKPVGLFSRYVNDIEATEKCFKGGYYLTGDRGFKDEDGYLWFVGRSDDVIISAGHRIGPFEVESALLEHDAVAESAVVSSPCTMRGSIVKAFVILSSGFTPSDELVVELQNHVKELTAPYKYPREIEFVDSLPKTISGKIRRVELRYQEWMKKS